MRTAIALMICATSLIGGCTLVGGSANWHPPHNAVLWAETPEGGKGDAKLFSAFKDVSDSTLYLCDVNNQRLLYTGLIKSGDAVRLYTDRAMVMPAWATTQPTDASDSSRYTVAQYPSGEHVRAYVLRVDQGMSSHP
jgi:hypothetical protein